MTLHINAMMNNSKKTDKIIYSEKATKFCEISTVNLTVTTLDKSTVEISQKFVAFSEYMNFIKKNQTQTPHFVFVHLQKR